MRNRESDFQARIVSMAKQFAWKVWHVPAPMVWDARSKAFRPARGGAGLPDLILLHDDPPRLVFMEVKREGGKLSDKQQEFLQAAKLIADAAWSWDRDVSELRASSERIVGVFAVWPGDEERVEQILRSRIVA